MGKPILWMFFSFFVLHFSVLFYPQQHDVSEGEVVSGEVKKDEGKGFNAVDMIMEHVGDSNDWHLWTKTDKNGRQHHVSVPLPVIIKDHNGWHMFLSSTVAHGRERSGYTLEDGRIVSTTGIKKATLFSLISGKQKFNEVFYDFSITKLVASLLFSVVFMVVIFVGMARGYGKSPVPSGFGKFMEPVIIFIRDEVAIPNVGIVKYKTYLPYLLTIFFFIWFNNLLGLIPFFPGGANLTGNIAVTCVLAVITLVITLFSANRSYWKHIFMPPVPLPLYIIMVPIEIIGIFTKPFALMMRLFANITAGHIMALAVVALIFIFKSPYLGFVSVPLGIFVSVLELLVAILQAYIFTILSALFIGLAVADHAHEEH
ncbi:MAG: F0F1 ATP synthase subunit A [Bergeyella sp.]|nr:F0F1 ATP synthase subunit A [Bergeyella sp.]